MINAGLLQRAIATHEGWKARLQTAASNGNFDAAMDTVKADDQCEFGKWLYGSALSAAETHPEHYHSVKELHTQFHQEAAKVAQLATSGQSDAAQKAMAMESRYIKCSNALTNAMVKWRESLHREPDPFSWTGT